MHNPVKFYQGKSKFMTVFSINIKTLTKLTWEVANNKEDLDMDHWSHKRAEQ